MKRHTEKPSKRGMRFFTPELYLRFNLGERRRAADQADEDWERAIRDYRAHMEEIGDQFTSGTAKTGSIFVCNDAELLAWSEAIEAARSGPRLMPQTNPRMVGCMRAILSLRQGSGASPICSICYGIAFCVSPAILSNWPFSPERKHWLYDEFLTRAPNSARFVHPAASFLATVAFSRSHLIAAVVLHEYLTRIPERCSHNGKKKKVMAG